MSNYDANLMDWDSAIESDGQQFIVLDEGDYHQEAQEEPR